MDAHAVHVVFFLQSDDAAVKIQPDQRRLTALKGDRALLRRGRKPLSHHGLERFLLHKAVGALLALFDDVVVEAVAAVQVAQPRGRLDKQMYVSHGSLLFSNSKKPRCRGTSSPRPSGPAPSTASPRIRRSSASGTTGPWRCGTGRRATTPRTRWTGPSRPRGAASSPSGGWTRSWTERRPSGADPRDLPRRVALLQGRDLPQ